MPDTLPATTFVVGSDVSPQERAARQAAVDYARTSSRLEGVILSPEHEALYTRFVAGELTDEECGTAVRALYGL